MIPKASISLQFIEQNKLVYIFSFTNLSAHAFSLQSNQHLARGAYEYDSEMLALMLLTLLIQMICISFKLQAPPFTAPG